MAGPSRATPDAERLAETLESVTHGAITTIGGTIVQKLLMFATNLLLTHSLGVSVYGVFALAQRIFMMVNRFAPLGSNPALVRYLPAYTDDPGSQQRILGLSYGTALGGSLVFATAIAITAPTLNAVTIDHPQFPTVLRIFALLVPFNVFITLFANVFRTLEAIEYQVLILRIARPGARLAAVAVAVHLGTTVVGTVVALGVATVGICVLAGIMTLVRTDVRPALAGARAHVREFLDHAVPNTIGSLGGLLRSRVDVLLIGFVLSASAAGIYNISLFLTGFVGLPLLAVNQLFPPIASRLYTNGDVAELQAAYSTMTRWVFSGALLVAVVELVYGTELLRLFGPEYPQGYLVLVLFVLGQLLNAAVGSAGWLLLMTDHQYLAAFNSWMLGALNVGLSYYFLLEFGLIGAALGTAGALGLINVVRVSALWYLEDLHPFTRLFAKPLAAALGMAAVSLVVKYGLSAPSHLVLTIGLPVGVVTFAACLSLLGFEQTDREFFSALYTSYVDAYDDRFGVGRQE